jgi:D-glycero-D-manno-heptose 1,7-bisphosphate phosphatase
MSALRPAVFLDRDGVLNRTTVRGGTPYPPALVAEVEILPGVEEALRRLRERGLPLIVVTNQPDVARGTQTQQAVEEINQYLARRLGVTAVYTCCHDDADDCACRKPRPGMLTRAASEHGIDLRRSFMVGDRWGDIAAGTAAGCTTLLIDMPYSQCHRCSPDFKVADLSEAAEIILRRLDEAIASASPPALGATRR